MKKTLLSALFIALVPFAHGEIIVEETFAAGRSKNDPPRSLAWSEMVKQSTEVIEGKGLRLFGASEEEQAIMATFPEVTLAPGDKLILRFNAELAGQIGGRNGAMRVGLYSTGGGLFEDGINPRTSATGYLFAITNHLDPEGDLEKNRMAVMLFERAIEPNIENPPLLTANHGHLPLKPSGMRSGFFENSTLYTLEFSIQPELTADGNAVSLGFRFEGGNLGSENQGEILCDNLRNEVETRFDAVVLVLRAHPGDGRGGFPEALFSNLRLEVIRKR